MSILVCCVSLLVSFTALKPCLILIHRLRRHCDSHKQAHCRCLLSWVDQAFGEFFNTLIVI